MTFVAFSFEIVQEELFGTTLKPWWSLSAIVTVIKAMYESNKT